MNRQTLAVVGDFTNLVHCEAVANAVVTMHYDGPKMASTAVFKIMTPCPVISDSPVWCRSAPPAPSLKRAVRLSLAGSSSPSATTNRSRKRTRSVRSSRAAVTLPRPLSPTVKGRAPRKRCTPVPTARCISRSGKCWWQCAKGPKWQDHKDHSATGCWSGNITRLAGWRASDLTLRKLPLQGKVQKRIVRPAVRGVPQWP
jgi:hypothetical protein